MMKKINRALKKTDTGQAGFILEPPVLRAKKQAWFSALILDFLLLASALSGTVLIFFSVFPLAVDFWVLGAMLLFFTLFFTVAFVFPKPGNLLVLFFAVLYCLCTYLLRAELAQGLILCVNQVIERLNDLLGSHFLLYVTEVSDYSTQRQRCTLFVLFMLTAFLCLLAWVVIRKKSTLPAFLLTFPLPLILLNFTPYPLIFLLFLIFWLVLFIGALGDKKAKDRLKKEISVHYLESGHRSVRSRLLWLPLLICLTAALSLFFFRYEPRQPQILNHWRTQVTEAVQTLWTGGASITPYGATLDRADLTQGGHISFSGETALRVKATSPAPMYLKGFTGSVYTGFSWEPLPDSSFSEISAAVPDSSLLNLSAQLDTAILQRHNTQFIQRTSYQELSLQNIRTNQKTIYFPYFLSTTPQNLPQGQFVSDHFIRSPLPLGSATYRLEALSLGLNRKSRDMSAAFFLENGRWETENYFQNTQVISLNSTEALEHFYCAPVSDTLLLQLDGEARALMELETAYSRFAYEHYTTLPDNLKNKLRSYLQTHFMQFVPDASGNVNLSLDAIVTAIQTMVQTSAAYTLSPGTPPDGRDFVDYFLFENRQGYCVHFASAAVALLRAYGIPARYAEGYIITNEEIQQAQPDGWMNIPDSKAHAWAEYYLPGTGWVPLEATPGYTTAPGNTGVVQSPAPSSVTSEPAPSSASMESSPAASVSSLPATDSFSPTAQEVSTPTAAEGAKPADFLPIVIFLLILLIPLSLIFIRHFIAVRRFQQLLQAEDTNKSLLKMHQKLVGLLSYAGLREPDFTQELAQKARYSAHKITPEEQKVLYDFYQKTAREYEQTLPAWKKLLFRYWHHYR